MFARKEKKRSFKKKVCAIPEPADASALPLFADIYIFGDAFQKASKEASINSSLTRKGEERRFITKRRVS